MAEDPDDTVRMPGGAIPPSQPAAGGRTRLRPLALLAAAGIGVAAWFALAPSPPTSSSLVQPASGTRANAPTVAVLPAAPPLASEEELLDARVVTATLFRLRQNPRVLVVLFPSLDAQGRAMNRLAALVEKAGLPRDRVLGDAELADAIGRSGDTPATWYFAHDYAGTDLARFFALAARDAVALTPEEAWLHGRFAEARAQAGPAEIAFISIAMPDQRMPEELRRAMLRHEIGHGEFFTRPEVARNVLDVWHNRFGERDRAAFRVFLGREGYDASNERLMANEAMAYLVFTPDPRLFSARHVGVTEPEIERLRALMQEAVRSR